MRGVCVLPLPIQTHASFPLSSPFSLQADALADFMTPMLEYLPEKRATAAEMLQHPWLDGLGSEGWAGPAAPAHGRRHRSPSPSPPSPRGANGAGGSGESER